MRILLQQIKTGLYFQEAREWTPHDAEAWDFLSSSKAIDYCARHRIRGVQLVIKFDEQPYAIVLPMVMESKVQTAGLRASP